jgi:solute carrier family 25 iron transporter 28/37
VTQLADLVGVFHVLQHMLAGAVAGITEHTAMYPVDTIKTRMQALSHPGQRVGLVALTRVKGS